MKKSKTRNIIGIVLGIILLVIVVLAFRRYSQKIQSNIDEYASTTLNEFTALQKNAVYSRLNENMNLLNNIAVLLEFEHTSFSQAEEVIQNIEIYHEFSQLLLFDVNGNVITSDQKAAEIEYKDIAAQFQDGDSIFHNPILSPINGDYMLPISCPIYDENKEEILYVLVGLHSLEVIKSFIENSFNENGNIGVITSDGELLFSNQLIQQELSIRDKYLEYLFEAVTTSFTKEQLLEDMSVKKSGTFIYYYEENEIFLQYVPLEINDWYIVIHINKSSLASRANIGTRAALQFLGTFGLCILILVIYIYVANSRVKKELYQLAFYDKLTKLPNGEYFKLKAEHILSKNSENTFLCIVFDICNFKLINDRFGSAIGDKVLCTVSNVIKEALGVFPAGTSFLAKLHSDTFVVLLPANITDDYEKKTLELIDHIRLATDFIGEYKLDLSLGRYFTQENDTSDIVLERALTAHSHAKRVAPNQFVNYDSIFIRSLHRRADILNSFDDAIKNGEFQIYFQPQFSASTKEIRGAEILVRWIKDEKIRYTPDAFIPVLEEAGRISKLDSYLREELCITIRSWLDAKMRLPHFSVNVSRIELMQSEFVTNLQTLLMKYDIDPTMIHIEVTETAYTGDHEYLVNKIIELQSCGFYVEMDDFGSGYSSLNVLKDIPIDIVKLDMKFIEDSTVRSGNILSSVVRMAKSIDLITIAEGVETQEQVSYLESIGCNYLQGYFFAKPMPKDEFFSLLEKEQ